MKIRWRPFYSTTILQFSNHTGYAGGLRGDVLDSNQLGTLIEGLKANNLHFYDFAVSGYIGSVSFLEKLADVLKELKEKNPDLVRTVRFSHFDLSQAI